MHANAVKGMVALAYGGKGVFTDVVKACLDEQAELLGQEKGTSFVAPAVLKKRLEAAGFEVRAAERGNNFQVEVVQTVAALVEAGHKPARDRAEESNRDPESQYDPEEDDLVAARATSHDGEDALLQAVFAEMKDESPDLWKKIAPGVNSVASFKPADRSAAAAGGEGPGNQPQGRPRGPEPKGGGGEGQKPAARPDRKHR